MSQIDPAIAAIEDFRNRNFAQAEALAQSLLTGGSTGPIVFDILGGSQSMQGKCLEALQTYTKALLAHPNDEGFWQGWRSVFARIGSNHLPDLQGSCRKLLPLRRAELGHPLLEVGLLKEGWELLEADIHRKDLRSSDPITSIPLYRQGQIYIPKNLLVYTHKDYVFPGLGDVFLFWRYFEALPTLAKEITLLLPKGMAGLAKHLPFEVVEELTSQKIQEFDSRLPMQLLPRRFGFQISLPPYVHPDPSLVEVWQERLASYPGLKVGICWRASATGRSTSPENFGRLLNIPRISFFSLLSHHPQAEADIQVLKGMGAITDLAPYLADWSETAAAVQCLDLVITVDTALANLCGAMGRTDWVIYPSPGLPEMRWCGTSWYPSIKVFTAAGVDGERGLEELWELTLELVKQELIQRINAAPTA